MNDNTKKTPENRDKSAMGRGQTRQQERQARQARSLRDNLKKRKQQARSRTDDEKPDA